MKPGPSSDRACALACSRSGSCTALVEGTDKEESNWIKVGQIIKACDSGSLTREDFYQRGDKRENQAVNMRPTGVAFVFVQRRGGRRRGTARDLHPH